jgi:hypothetical protein
MENPKNQRSSFPKEQDQFIAFLISQFQPSFHGKLFWRKISEAFNQKFPNSRRSGSIIRNHYDNIINPNLNRGNLSQMEKQIFIQYLYKYGCSFQKISRLMNRTLNSLKNYYYRNLQKVLKEEEIIYITQISSQHKNKNPKIKKSFQSYKNDFDQSDQENKEFRALKAFEMTHFGSSCPNLPFDNDQKKTFGLKKSDLTEFSFEPDNSLYIVKNQQIEGEKPIFDRIDIFHPKPRPSGNEINISTQMKNYEIQRHEWYSQKENVDLGKNKKCFEIYENQMVYF